MQPCRLHAIDLSLFFAALAGVTSLASPRADPSAAYEHQTWRTENGLPQNSVHSIIQTSDGYIWVATEGGVARFDGIKFVVFDRDNTPELRNNNVRGLLETNDKSLWIATADGLTRLQNGNFKTFTTADGLPSNNVGTLLQGRAGTLRVITAEGIAVYQNGRFIRQAADASYENGNAAVSLTDRRGRLWIGTKGGLVIRENGQVKTTNLHSRPYSNITAIIEDQKGAIWIGTETGVVRIVDDKVYPVAFPDSVSHGFILSLFEDREGDVWVGTDSDGLTVFRDQRFRKFGRDEGMPDALVRCIFEDSHGTLWAGTNGYGLRRFNGQTFSSFTTAQGLSSDVILALAADVHGDLVVGTPDGLNIIQKGHVQRLTSADGLPDDLVRSIYKDSYSSLWIGTRRGLAHYAEGRVTTYTTADGLPSDLVGAILHSRDGRLWVGTLKGLIYLDNGRVVRSASLEGVHKDAITSLFEDREGVLWIGGETGGLTRLEGQQAFEFPPSLGLPNTVSGIVEDSNGQLWITSPRGLFRVSRAELNAYAARKSGSVSVISYNTGDGLPINEFSAGGHPTVWRDHSNTIWFASAKGIVSIDASHTGINPIPPSVVVEHVAADDRLFDHSRVAAFGPNLSRLAIEYTGLSFAAPQQIRFKYRLEGFDRTWIDAGTRRTAYYTNLRPGKYRFVVLGRNNDGLWNMQGASLSFELRPHFYQTNWFRALLSLAFASFVYAAYRLRVNHVRMQFTAVIAERNRIAREIHDTLAQGFVGVSVQLEIVRRLMTTSIESASEALQHAQNLVQEGLAEARRAIWDLRSDGAKDNDLASKLSRAVRKSVRDKDLDVKIEVAGAYRPLPTKVESEVLRIGQEAVRNVVRHANATRLDVSLAFDSTKARMTICDDGQGFTPDEYAAGGADGHFGLRGMRERAEGINAKLSVTTAAGKGTQVLLELPLK